jgi:hypothetical protein
VSDTSEATLVAEEPMEPQAPPPPAAPPSGPRLLALPATASGWWAFALESVVVVLLGVGTWLSSASMQTALWGRIGTVNDILFVVTPIALLLSAVGGVLAISTIVRRRERSVLVWFAAVVFVLAAAVVAISIL